MVFKATALLFLLPSIQAVDVVANFLSPEECKEYLERPVENLLEDLWTKKLLNALLRRLFLF